MSGRLWSEDDVEQLFTLRSRGAGWTELGRMFGRSARGVQEKHREGNAPRESTERAAKVLAVARSEKLLAALKKHHGPTALITGDDASPAQPVAPPVVVWPTMPESIELPAEVYNGVERIKRVVAKSYNLRLSEIESKRRVAQIVRARQIAMYLCTKLTTKSTPDIGRRFGGKDHTTVLHAERKIGDLIKTDHDLADEISKLAKQIVEQRDAA